MGGDSFRTVDYVYNPVGGRGGRDGGGLGAPMVGVLMLASSVGVLWWNEGRTRAVP